MKSAIPKDVGRPTERSLSRIAPLDYTVNLGETALYSPSARSRATA